MTSFPTIDKSKYNPLYSNFKCPWGETRDIYLIPIELLHMNKDNGRIASYVAGYENTPGKKPFDEMDLEEWNDTLSALVLQSASKEANFQTKNSLKRGGQNVAGLIFDDGTIVSGNRRFSLLRELKKDGEIGQFGYFMCAIEPTPRDPTLRARRLKELETLTTYGVVDPTKYGAIERLVDAYRSALAPGAPYTKTEYAHFLVEKDKSKINLLFLKAEILIDYLEFIGQPFNYEVARVNDLDGPIQELARIKSRLKNQQRENEWLRVKPLFYYELWKGKASSGDKPRIIRKLDVIYKSGEPKFSARLRKVEEAMITGDWASVEKTVSSPSAPTSPASGTGNGPIPAGNSDWITEASTADGIKRAKRKPLEIVGKVRGDLSKIDREDIRLMEPRDREEFYKQVEALLADITKFRKG